MPIPYALLTDEIKGALYYGEYQEHVAKYQQYLDAEHGKAEEGAATESSKATKVTKPKAAKAIKPASDPKPKLHPLNHPKLFQKRKENYAEDVPVEEPAYNEEEANLQRALELSLKEQAKRTQGPARPVTLKNKSPVDQFIFQRRTPMPTEASGPAESPSLDAELALTDSETESDDVMPKINTGDQDKGQARPNPGIQDEGQSRPNPGVQDEGQAGLNLGDAVESQP
nr:hypothetical protein [Tanacetum cinerariifolium]